MENIATDWDNMDMENAALRVRVAELQEQVQDMATKYQELVDEVFSSYQAAFQAVVAHNVGNMAALSSPICWLGAGQTPSPVGPMGDAQSGQQGGPQGQQGMVMVQTSTGGMMALQNTMMQPGMQSGVNLESSQHAMMCQTMVGGQQQSWGSSSEGGTGGCGGKGDGKGGDYGGGDKKGLSSGAKSKRDKTQGCQQESWGWWSNGGTGGRGGKVGGEDGGYGGGDKKGLSSVAKSRIVKSEADQLVPDETKTTVMIQNIPNLISQEQFLVLLDEGFKGLYDFAYLPMNFLTAGNNLGYGLVNFKTPLDAKRFFDGIKGQKWQFEATVEWAEPLQGKDAYVEKYRNSAVMHHSVPSNFKPMVFENGKMVNFPPPTKRICPPKRRPMGHEQTSGVQVPAQA